MFPFSFILPHLTQSWVSSITFYLSLYSTKLNQIQYATLFQPQLENSCTEIISFVQPQPNLIQNKNNPIGCGTAPGNLVQSVNAISQYCQTEFKLYYKLAISLKYTRPTCQHNHPIAMGSWSCVVDPIHSQARPARQ